MSPLPPEAHRIVSCQSPVEQLDLLALHQAAPERHPFLLESVSGNPHTTARYSLLLGGAQDVLSLDEAGLFENGERLDDNDFLKRLDQHFRAGKVAAVEGPCNELPFVTGWFLYLGYELAGQVEPRLRMPATHKGLPTALAVRCRSAIIKDHSSGAIHLVAASDEELSALTEEVRSLGSDVTSGSLGVLCRYQEADDTEFLRGVAHIQEYIRAGDVFQVNLSRDWCLDYAEPVNAVEIYRRLRLANPAPFGGLMQWRGGAVISSSPERLITVNAQQVQTRPIAGTRPRGKDDASDDHERTGLLMHPKERAEHIMLIDLERNDLGRVCKPGSVEVDELLGLETYAHVHHIVSNVSGTLRPECSPVDAIRAVFPGGTITGCPKVRCMEIIAELEGAARGPYTGAMGYLDMRGHMDLNILIRSMQVADTQLKFRAGAGIVADSLAERELEETRAKARGLLRALDIAT